MGDLFEVRCGVRERHGLYPLCHLVLSHCPLCSPRTGILPLQHEPHMCMCFVGFAVSTSTGIRLSEILPMYTDGRSESPLRVWLTTSATGLLDLWHITRVSAIEGQAGGYRKVITNGRSDG